MCIFNQTGMRDKLSLGEQLALRCWHRCQLRKPHCLYLAIPGVVETGSEACDSCRSIEASTLDLSHVYHTTTYIPPASYYMYWYHHTPTSCSYHVHPCKSHDHDHQWAYLVMTWLPQNKRNRGHKVLRLVWEFDCLHFAQYISIRPHGIDSKHTWCKTIYNPNRATFLMAGLARCLLKSLSQPHHGSHNINNKAEGGIWWGRMLSVWRRTSL